MLAGEDARPFRAKLSKALQDQIGELAANAVRPRLHALAYNLRNALRTLATPESIKDLSLPSFKIKTARSW